MTFIVSVFSAFSQRRTQIIRRGNGLLFRLGLEAKVLDWSLHQGQARGFLGRIDNRQALERAEQLGFQPVRILLRKRLR